MQGSSPGEVLREARRSRDISIEYIARQLRLAVNQIDALENDNYKEMAASIFVQGYIRSYANLLGLDSQPLIERFIDIVGETPKPILSDPLREKKNLQKKSIIPVKSLGYFVVSGFIVLALVLIYNTKNIEDDFPVPGHTRTALKESGFTAVTKMQTVSSPTGKTGSRKAKTKKRGAQDQDTLSIRFKRATYVEVFDATNRALLAHTGRAGFRDKVKGKAPFRIKLGKPEYVEVRLNGEIFNHMRMRKKGISKTILVNTN